MVEKSSTLLPMHLPIQGDRMHLQIRLGFMLTALLALAPPATATSPPSTSANDISSIAPQQTIGTPAIPDVAITRTDQDLAIGDFYLGASRNSDIDRTTIGSSPPNTGDVVPAGPPDKIEASPGMLYAKNTTKLAISKNFMRSSSATADDHVNCGEPTNAPEYNLLCRQSAGHEHK